MVKEGAFDNPTPDAVFGLHVWGAGTVGQIGYRSGGMMASSDLLRITVKGKQTHGAAPWAGVDPIVVSSQIVLGLQTIASRQLNVTKTPSIVTIGTIHGGVRFNIIPDEVQLDGTIRTFNAEVQDDLHRRIKVTAESIAASAGATANVTITRQYPVTVNDPGLTETMLSTLRRVAGADMVSEQPLVTAAEDFSFFAQRAPGLYIFLDRPGRAWMRRPRRQITRRFMTWMRACYRSAFGHLPILRPTFYRGHSLARGGGQVDRRCDQVGPNRSGTSRAVKIPIGSTESTSALPRCSRESIAAERYDRCCS